MADKTPSSDDLLYMRRAMLLARKGGLKPGANPIGCVIVLDGEIIGEGHNEVDLRHDPSAHAEVVALRRAGEKTGRSEFSGATLYSTLQPCGMCSMASIWARIGRIVYGAERHQVHESYFEARHLDTMDFIADAFRADITVVGGVLDRECAALYAGPADPVPEATEGNA